MTRFILGEDDPRGIMQRSHTTRFNTLRPQPTTVDWGLSIIVSRDSPPQDSNMKLSALLNKLVTHPTALSGGP